MAWIFFDKTQNFQLFSNFHPKLQLQFLNCFRKKRKRNFFITVEPASEAEETFLTNRRPRFESEPDSSGKTPSFIPDFELQVFLLKLLKASASFLRQFLLHFSVNFCVNFCLKMASQEASVLSVGSNKGKIFLLNCSSQFKKSHVFCKSFFPKFLTGGDFYERKNSV